MFLRAFDPRALPWADMRQAVGLNKSESRLGATCRRLTANFAALILIPTALIIPNFRADHFQTQRASFIPTTNFGAYGFQTPKASLIPAQGNALGSSSQNELQAKGLLHIVRSQPNVRRRGLSRATYGHKISRSIENRNPKSENDFPPTVIGAKETNHSKLNDNLGTTDDPATKVLLEFVDACLK